jgi:hypothetical protein
LVLYIYVTIEFISLVHLQIALQTQQRHIEGVEV